LKKIALFLLSFLLIFSSCTSVPQTDDNTLSQDPVPYEKEEFPTWARDLRRSEVLYLGALPLVYMLTNLAYDSIMPQILGDEGSAGYSEGKHLDNKLIITFSLSGVISVTDYILGKIEQRNENP